MTAELRQAIERWETELDRIAESSASDGWRVGERRFAESQHTITAYRAHILPNVAHRRPYDVIVADELTRLVDRLEGLRNDLFGTAQDHDAHQQIAETLASLRTLAHVTLRFDLAAGTADALAGGGS